MRSIIQKFFLWFRDHFLCWIEVYLRLHIGEEKKEKPIVEMQGTVNPDHDEDKIEHDEKGNSNV